MVHALIVSFLRIKRSLQLTYASLLSKGSTTHDARYFFKAAVWRRPELVL